MSPSAFRIFFYGQRSTSFYNCNAVKCLINSDAWSQMRACLTGHNKSVRRIAHSPTVTSHPSSSGDPITEVGAVGSRIIERVW